MSTVCSTRTTSVGTSTNCSAICGSQRAERSGMGSSESLRTAIPCSTTAVSSLLNTSISWSPVCGTRASRICTKGLTSAMCSTVCCRTRSCGPRGSARLAALHRALPQTTGRAPAGGEVHPERRRVVHLEHPSSPPALAMFCPRGAAWWLLSARAMATLIRAYLK